MRAFILHVSLLTLTAGLAAGCASTGAAPAKHEPLAVPPPPPRVITQLPEEQQDQPAGSDHEPVPPLPRVQRPAARDTGAPRQGTSAPAQPPAPGGTVPATTPEAEAAAKPPQAPAAQPAPELRTVETPDDAKATKLVRESLDRAAKRLSGIDYRALPKGSQLQYDMAKRFIEQSEEALKARNYTAAQLMAEKAETIARELAGR